MMKKDQKKRSFYPLRPELLEDFRRSLELDEKSPSTVQKYLHDVGVFLNHLEKRKQVSKEDLIAYKKWLAGRYAVRSANSMLIAANQFLRFSGAGECCVKLFKIQQDTFCDQRKELTKAEYRQLLNAALARKEKRLYFMLQTLCATGIRVSELKYITVEAARSETAVARNKGKSRVILLPGELCGALLEYAGQAGIESGPVFITRGGKPVDRSNVWAAMKRLCREAGILEGKVYPHNLRHLFARTFYEQEKDIMRLADVLGHRNINTTRIYLLSSGEQHRAQIEALQLFVPDQKESEESKEKQQNTTLCCFSGNKICGFINH